MNWVRCDELIVEVFVQQKHLGFERTEEILECVLTEIERFHGHRLQVKRRARILPRTFDLLKRLRREIRKINRLSDRRRVDEFFANLSLKIESNLNGESD